MGDFKPGDLVVCVDARPHCRDPLAPGLHRGRCYRVYDIDREIPSQVWLVEHVGMKARDGRQYSFNRDRFRKLNDEADDAELIERIRKCKPVRENSHA